MKPTFIVCLAVSLVLNAVLVWNGTGYTVSSYSTIAPTGVFQSASGSITAGCPLSTNQLSTTKRGASPSVLSSTTADQWLTNSQAK